MDSWQYLQIVLICIWCYHPNWASPFQFPTVPGPFCKCWDYCGQVYPLFWHSLATVVLTPLSDTLTPRQSCSPPCCCGCNSILSPNAHLPRCDVFGCQQGHPILSDLQPQDEYSNIFPVPNGIANTMGAAVTPSAYALNMRFHSYCICASKTFWTSLIRFHSFHYPTTFNRVELECLNRSCWTHPGWGV